MSDPDPEREPTAQGTSPDALLPRPAILLGVVVTAALATFAPSVDGPWLFDDTSLIAGNPYLHGFSHWQRWLFSHFWDVGDGRGFPFMIFWRPLVLASYATDWTISDGTPQWFHVTNLATHGLSSALVFLLLRRWTGSVGSAFVAALLFAVHPTRTENVAWISGRTDILLMIGLLVAMHGLALRLAGRRWAVALEVLGAAVAYTSKENAVLLPLFAIVEFWVAQGRPPLTAIRWRTGAHAIVPYILTTVLFLGWRQYWLGSLVDVRAAEPLPWWSTQSWGVILESVGRAFILTFWPADLSLGSGVLELRNGYPVASPTMATVGALVLVGAITMIVVSLRRWPRLALGGLLWLGLLAPVALFTSLGSSVCMSPRLLYVPLLPVVWVLVEIATELQTRLPSRRLLPAAAVLVFGACTIQSAIRSEDFASPDRFWAYEIRRNPNHMHSLAYYVRRELASGRPRSAIALAHEAFARTKNTSERGARGLLVGNVLRAVAIVTPDKDRQTLMQLQRFAANIIAARPAELHIKSLGLHLQIVPGSAESDTLQALPATLRLLEARTACRLGQDATARRAVRQALDACPTCEHNLIRLTLVALCAQDLAFTDHIIDTMAPFVPDEQLTEARKIAVEGARRYAVWKNAPAWKRRAAAAHYFVLVSAWGRAFEWARPTLESGTKPSPKTELALAELAYRAGHRDIAQRTFERHLSPEATAARLHDLGLRMRWIDAPPDVVPPTEAIPLAQD